jgi:hypothetical protein
LKRGIFVAAKTGAGDRDRTGDIQLGKLTIYSIRKVSLTVVLCVVLVPIFFVNARAFLQGHHQVTMRKCGHLRLGEPGPDAPYATDEIPFALLSEAAYDEVMAQIPPDETKDDCKPMAQWRGKDNASQMGWCPWNSAFLEKDRQAFFKHNLRVAVWQNPTLSLAPNGRDADQRKR